MRKILFALGLLLFSPVTFATIGASGLVQIVTFEWNGESLKALSLGSGTAIDSNLILTNRHVVSKSDGTPADFLLLCPAKTKASQPVECNVAAGVVALHSQFDAALVRSLDENVFLPRVPIAERLAQKGENIRINGFPLPVDSLQNFGGTQTLANVKAWESDGGTIRTGGDKLTVTRGVVQQLAKRVDTNEIYYLTNVKVNSGNSGGAAFDEHGSFIGIPTMRDREYNALVLAYPQLEEWIATERNNPAKVEEVVLNFYEKKSQQPALSRQPLKTTSGWQEKSPAYQTLLRTQRPALEERRTQKDSLENVKDRSTKNTIRRTRVIKKPSDDRKPVLERQRRSYRSSNPRVQTPAE